MSRAACLWLILLIAPASVRADPPPSAEMLQQRLRAAFPGLGTLLTVTRDGERDRIAIATPKLKTTGPSEIVATVRPEDNGQWAIESLRIPSPATMSVSASPPATGSSEFALAIGKQAVSGIFDPAFLAKSAIDFDYTDFDLGISTPTLRQFQQTARHHGSIAIEPRPDGKLDIGSSTTLTGFVVTEQRAGVPRIAYSVDRLDGSAQLHGVDRERVGALFDSFARLGALSRKGMSGPAPDPPDRSIAMHAVLASLAGIATDAVVQDSADGMKFNVGGKSGTLDHSALEVKLDTPQGILMLGLDLTADGLHVPGLTPDAAALLPAHVHLHPWLGGISGADLLAFIDATDRRKTDPAALALAIAALFTHGGIKVGIDEITMDSGIFKLAGDVSFAFADPTPLGFSGKGHLSAQGLDALVALVQADPADQKLLTTLIFLKGLGRQDGNGLVWDLVFSPGTVVVNGTSIPLRPETSPTAPLQ